MFGFGACTVNDIREVDWFKKSTREYEFLVVSFSYVNADGSRGLEDESFEYDHDHPTPDHSYSCTRCGECFWFWSEVMHHVADALTGW